MSLLSDDTPLVLAPGARVLVKSDGRGVVILGSRKFVSNLTCFPWEVLCERCSQCAMPLSGIRSFLLEGDQSATASMIDTVLTELCKYGILHPETHFSAAVDYHLASGYGRFQHPNWHQPSPDSCEPRPDAAQRVPSDMLNRPLAECLVRRRSVRRYGTRYVDPRVLYDLLWASYGETSERESGMGRVVPSAGGIYPLTLMVIARRILGYPSGVYEYSSSDDRLTSRPTLIHEGIIQSSSIDTKSAAALVVVIANLQKVCGKYGERGYRFALLEAGHVVQNLCLAATALELGHVPIGGFDDELLNATLGCTENEYAVYCVALGYPE